MNDEALSPEEIPTATVRPSRSVWLLHSNMWWITLACVGLAGYLAWQSHRPAGMEIAIHFPEGHGLKAGDSLRHRGIEIGMVTEVELADDLHQVLTTVSLDQSAEGIATEGSRFWIVRPQFSLTNISGLETAVGAKYIAVDPGPVEGVRKRDFNGLPEPPAIESEEDGIEIGLRAEQSFGLNPSSPVTYRGVAIGKIVSVDLADNAMEVRVVAYIENEFRHLLRASSKFWKTSGVDIDFGLRGFRLSTESLASVAMGGVSLVTTEERDGSHQQTIEPGHAFQLHAKLEEKWLDNAFPINRPQSP